MKSYIKIYGPPVWKAIEELEKIALDMPEVCIYDKILDHDHGLWGDPNNLRGYFRDKYSAVIGLERCGKIISKSGETLGEYDFFFEWFRKPTLDELNSLIEKIDKALESVGCRYTIVTK